jgi:hypothetical protein
MTVTGATLHLVLMIILTPISFGAYFALVWWFFSHQAENSQAKRIDQIWGHRHTWGEPLCRQLIARQIEPGMTPEMVILAWGHPTAVHPLPDGGEKWEYPTGQITLHRQQVIATEGNPPGGEGKMNVWRIIAIVLGVALLVCAITLMVIVAAG